MNPSPGLSGERDCFDYMDSCEYYRCRESIQPCGEDGYFLRFAYPYCSRFMEGAFKEALSTEGANWVDRVATCLRLELALVPTSTSCEAVVEKASESHTACYLSTGFCNLAYRDQFQLLKYIYPELRDHHFLQAFWNILSECHLSYYLNVIYN